MIYLHIGLHKCASSYLQSILFSNIDVLSEHGFHYIDPIALSQSDDFQYKNKFAMDSGNMSLPLIIGFGEHIKKWHIFDANELNP